MQQPAEPVKTLLITLTGKDRPGVTSRIFSTVAAFGVTVLDIEQIVLRRRLVLGVLVTVPRDWRALSDAGGRGAAEPRMQGGGGRGAGGNKPRPQGRSPPDGPGMPPQPAAVAAPP